MPGFTVTSPGAYGRQQLDRYKFSQVLDLGDRVEISGQGGWNPESLDYPAGTSLQQEISYAFDNVATMLASVGLNWANVGHVNSYHKVEADGQITGALDEMVRQFGLRFENHKPIWTCLGVAALGDPGMRVEIRVTAYR